MNFGKLKYKSLLIGAGATMLLATSCKDFLNVDDYSSYTAATLTSKKSYQSLSSTLYGGYKWSQYEGKFSWCVNEGLPGVLFNVNDQEGALFRLSIGEDNSILAEGYKSLYSGVISQANQIIHLVSDSVAAGAIPADMTAEDLNAVLGEAYLFRGYAHFLATEYFGECPLVLNTGNDISQNKTLPRVSRATLYAAIEKDLQMAYALLPYSQSDSWRATRYSAGALLGKLYLTMASCREATPGLVYPYVCPDPAVKLTLAIQYLNEIYNAKTQFSLDTHANIFAGENRTTPSKETVFALYWRMGDYAEGSAYQSQMARSSEWSPGSGWGVGKGLTYTLFNSFSDDDARKKELCFYVGNGTGNGYQTIEGDKAWYGSDYASKLKSGEVQFGATGKDFLSEGQHLMNNIKKMIWGVNGTSSHGSGMSIDRRQDVIRLSDVYFMLAEAWYLYNGYGLQDIVTDASVLGPINEVLSAHGAPEIKQISYFQDFETVHTADEVFKYTVTVDDGNGGGVSKEISVPAGVPMFHGEIRTDLVQQRRKEFAMEGQAWLDLKRFYYLSPELANKFLYQMDRACCFTNSPEVPEGDALFQTEAGYTRLALAAKCQDILGATYGTDQYAPITDKEVEIFTETFIARNRWYLPIPESEKALLQPSVLEMSAQVISGEYEY